MAGALSLGACNPFRGPLKQDPVAQGTTHDANVDSRWHGTLTSPSNLAGAVQMTGQISMSPGSSGGNTNVAYWANPETIVVCGNLAAPTL